MILPLVGWYHDRIDTNLNEERKLLIFRLKTRGLLSRKFTLNKLQLIMYVNFSDFDKTWPKYSSDISAEKDATL